MHWTALLAKRRYGRDARVGDDLPCGGCGYNLRGALASGNCPECGTAVGDSLFVVRQPDELAAALRLFAKSYLGLAAVILLLGGATGFGWIGLFLLLCATVCRLVAVIQLRVKSSLEVLPVIGGRVILLWWVVCLEVTAAALATSAFFLEQSAAPGSNLESLAATLVPVGGLAWLSAALAAAVVMGLAGGTLATLLGYDFVETEFRIQRWFLAGSILVAAIPGALAILFLALDQGPTAAVMSLIAAGVVLLGWMIGIGYTFVAVLHLAGAAEREREAREDVLETDDDDVDY